MEALLRAVNATNDFEADMATRFGGGTGAASEEVHHHLLHSTWLTSKTGALLSSHDFVLDDPVVSPTARSEASAGQSRSLMSLRMLQTLQ